MEEIDITKEVSVLRKEFRDEKGIVVTTCSMFLNYLPEYCDWLEEKIIAAQKNEDQRTSHNGQITPLCEVDGCRNVASRHQCTDHTCWECR